MVTTEQRKTLLSISPDSCGCVCSVTLPSPCPEPQVLAPSPCPKASPVLRPPALPSRGALTPQLSVQSFS